MIRLSNLCPTCKGPVKKISEDDVTFFYQSDTTATQTLEQVREWADKWRRQNSWQNYGLANALIELNSILNRDSNV